MYFAQPLLKCKLSPLLIPFLELKIVFAGYRM